MSGKAYVAGVDTMKAPDGSDFKMETIHFLAKESTGWKVLFGTLSGPIRKAFGWKPMPQDRYAEYFKPPQELSSDEAAIRDIIAKIDGRDICARTTNKRNNVRRLAVNSHDFVLSWIGDVEVAIRAKYHIRRKSIQFCTTCKDTAIIINFFRTSYIIKIKPAFINCTYSIVYFI